MKAWFKVFAELSGVGVEVEHVLSCEICPKKREVIKVIAFYDNVVFSHACTHVMNDLGPLHSNFARLRRDMLAPRGNFLDLLFRSLANLLGIFDL